MIRFGFQVPRVGRGDGLFEHLAGVCQLAERPLFDSGEPGVSHLAAEWFHERGLVAIGADNCAVDVLPGEDGVRAYGLHPRIINQQGGYLIEYLDLEELSRLRATEFLFVASPLMITGAAGSPLNPVAIL